MPRLDVPTRDGAPPESRANLDRLSGRMGVPAGFRLMGSSPPALDGYLSMSDALEGALDLKMRTRIAIAVSQLNGCDYSLSANRYTALNVAKLGPDEVALNRRGRSADPRADAMVGFACKVVETKGRVADAELAAVRQAGVTDREIVEIVVVSAHASLTNWLNELAETEIDFPVVRSADLTSDLDQASGAEL